MPYYKVEVIADSTGNWCGNGITYTTKEHAEQSARDLAMRWTAVRDWRVIEVAEPPVGDTVKEAPTTKGANHRVTL